MAQPNCEIRSNCQVDTAREIDQYDVDTLFAGELLT